MMENSLKSSIVAFFSSVKYLERGNLAFQTQAIGFLLIALVHWTPLGATLIYYNLCVFVSPTLAESLFSVEETCKHKVQ